MKYRGTHFPRLPVIDTNQMCTEFYWYLGVFILVQVIYQPYWKDRSGTHACLVQANTFCLFLLTWLVRPVYDNWEFQPLYTILLPVWSDFWFYATHRLLHTRLLFSHVHCLHHKWVQPCPVDAFFSHPLENIIHNWLSIGIPLLAWPGFSNMTLAIGGPALLLSSLSAHCPGTTHTKHHQTKWANLGAGFYFWDWIADSRL